MAFPLHSILNARDISPTKKLDQQPIDDDDASSTDLASPDNSSESPLTPHPTVIQPATLNIRPPLVFSPQKGLLYNRRYTKSPTRVPSLPTPPTSDLSRLFWYDEPPSHELDFNRFTVFGGLINHPELVFEIAKHLDVEDLVSLYAISKDFHRVVNGRFTALILAQSIGKASESSRTFIFRCYQNLCIHDPAARPNEEVDGEIRWVPSFRWLRMILFRENVVDDILALLGAEGHRLPKRASLVLKKIWFMMDISDNARRVGLMHNRTFWENKDLFIATMFFLKLDMRLTDPFTGNGELGLRKMLLAQRSLSKLRQVLKREEMLNQLEMLQMFVRWKYRPLRRRNRTILGVPAHEVGKGMYEGYGSGTEKVLAPDALVMREGVRRKMDLHKRYLDMMIWGYVDKTTFQDIWVTAPPTEEKELTEDSDSDDSDGEHSTEEEEQVEYVSFNLSANN